MNDQYADAIVPRHRQIPKVIVWSPVSLCSLQPMISSIKLHTSATEEASMGDMRLKYKLECLLSDCFFAVMPCTDDVRQTNKR